MKEKRQVICGVYQIRNKINGLIYIGSSNNIYNRWTVHRRHLRNNVHTNYLLQNDWNKYGENSFDFTIIEHCDQENQFIREQHYIDITECWVRGIGYNIIRNVDKPPLSCGENCGASKYTNEQIMYVIELLLKPDLSLIEISKITGVEYSTVCSVYYKNTWKHLSKDISFPQHNDHLNDNVVSTDIIPRILRGEPDEVIARDFNVSSKSIAEIRLHKSFKHLTDGIYFEKHTLTGENANSSKLTKEDVLDIVNSYNVGSTPTELMKKYNVGRHAILDILHKITWVGVTKDLYIRPVSGKIKLTEEDVKTIIYKLKHGSTIQSLADEYQVYNSTIQKIKYGETWKYINRDIL